MANICVYAATDQNKPVAIIVPNEPALKTLAAEHGIKGEHEELIHNKKLNNIVLQEMLKTGKGGGLNGIELIQGVAMAEEEWTPANVRPASLLFLSCEKYTCCINTDIFTRV